MISQLAMPARPMHLRARGELALVAAVLAAVAVPDRVGAQTSFDVIPSFNVAQMYDTNLFAVSSNLQPDFITRLTPGIKSEYRSTMLTLLGRYALDSEYFADHPELTSVDVRQQAALGFEYRPTQRLALAADAELRKTQTPGELNPLTGLMFSRARARQVAAHSSITRRFNRVTSATLDYRFTEDRIAGGLEVRDHTIRAHTATVGTDHHVSLRDTVGVDYRFYEFRFGSEGPGVSSATTSHALGVVWTRSMTRRLSISIDGGPRLTNASLAPDLAASVRYQVRRIDLSLAYACMQTTVVGLAGIAESQSIIGTAAWSAWPSLQMRVSPAAYRSVLAGLQADVYRLSVGVVHPIANALSLDVTLDANVQRGNLHPFFAHETVRRHSMMIRLVAAPATRMH